MISASNIYIHIFTLASEKLMGTGLRIAHSYSMLLPRFVKARKPLGSIGKS